MILCPVYQAVIYTMPSFDFSAYIRTIYTMPSCGFSAYIRTIYIMPSFGFTLPSFAFTLPSFGFSAYIRTDIIRRVLIHMFNIDVVLVMGVTDIDDKIIKRAKEVYI